MRFYMNDDAAQALHDAVETGDLLVDGCGDLGRPHSDLDPAEVGAVGVAGVSADPHAAIQREARGSLHDVVVAGVTAAGDVGAGDVFQQRGFVGGVFKLAHVAIDIERHEDYLTI